jgi:hypothetical protein
VLPFESGFSEENREVVEISLVEKFAGTQNAGRLMILEDPPLHWQGMGLQKANPTTAFGKVILPISFIS